MVAIKERVTFKKMESIAFLINPCSKRTIVSMEKVEKVVKAPKKPVIQKTF